MFSHCQDIVYHICYAQILWNYHAWHFSVCFKEYVSVWYLFLKLAKDKCCEPEIGDKTVCLVLTQVTLRLWWVTQTAAWVLWTLEVQQHKRHIRGRHTDLKRGSQLSTTTTQMWFIQVYWMSAQIVLWDLFWKLLLVEQSSDERLTFVIF